MATQYKNTIDTSSANVETPFRYPDIYYKSNPEKTESKTSSIGKNLSLIQRSHIPIQQYILLYKPGY